MSPPPSYIESGPSTGPPAYTSPVGSTLSRDDVMAQLQAQAEASRVTAGTCSSKGDSQVSQAYVYLSGAAKAAQQLTNPGSEGKVHDLLLQAQTSAPWRRSVYARPSASEMAFIQTAKNIRVSAFQALVLSRRKEPSRFPTEASLHAPSFWQCGKDVQYTEMTGTLGKSVHHSYGDKKDRAGLVSHVSGMLVSTHGTSAR